MKPICQKFGCKAPCQKYNGIGGYSCLCVYHNAKNALRERIGRRRRGQVTSPLPNIPMPPAP